MEGVKQNMRRMNTGRARRLLDELLTTGTGVLPEDAAVVFEVSVDGKLEGTITLAELYESDIDQCESEGVLRELDEARVGAIIRCGGGAMPTFEYKRIA